MKVKKYYPEIIIFGILLFTYLACALPDYTWVNTDSDGIHYTYAARELVPAHKTSAPLFLLLGHLFIQLPFGTEAWRFDLLLIMATLISSLFIYLSVYQLSHRNRIASCISTLIFGGSALVISQTSIIDSYALITMFCLGAYYFSLKGKWLLSSIFMGGGLATHHLIGLVILVLFVAYKELRNWKYILITLSFLAFYAYIPITVAINHPINMWGNQTLDDFFRDSGSTGTMLIGGLAIYDLPKRILDTIGVVGVSLGLAIIPIIYFIKRGKRIIKNPLIYLFLGYIVYFCTDLAPQTVVYLFPSIGFGAIIAGIILPKLHRYWQYAVLACAIGLLGFNMSYFDLGKTLDKNLSATNYYRNELGKVPDNQILMPQYGWEWAAIIPYNKEFNRNIIDVCMDTLSSPTYQQQLKDKGVRFNDDPELDRIDRRNFIALSIVELNDNVWSTKITDSRTYGCEIIQAKGNERYLLQIPKEPPAQWHWKPDNPYDMITGAIEIDKWGFVTLSSYNMMFYTPLALCAGGFIWIILKLIKRRKVYGNVPETQT